MIYSILQSYLNVLISVAAASFLILAFGLFWILKPSKRKPNIGHLNTNAIHASSDKAWEDVKIADKPREVQDTIKFPETPFSPPDLTAIAGDDLMATQLDLARAYIETGKTKFAKSILKQVLAQGSDVEKHEAEQLLVGL